MTIDIYDCIPTVIDTYTANGGNSGGSSTTIVRKSSKMVIILEATSSDYACNLPVDAIVGDAIEIYSNREDTFLYTSSSDTFFNPAGSITSLATGSSNILRKISDTQWVTLKGTNVS